MYQYTEVEEFKTAEENRSVMLEEAWMSEKKKLDKSTLDGVAMHYTDTKITQDAILYCLSYAHIKYLKIGSIAKAKMKQIMCFVLQNMKQVQELELENEPQFLTTYPRCCFALRTSPESKDQIGYKICSNRLGFNDEIFDINVSSLKLSYNYNIIHLKDAGGMIEIDDIEYECLIHLKDIKHNKSSEYHHDSYSIEDHENIVYNIKLPDRLSSLDLINLEIGKDTLKYLSDRILSTDWEAKYGPSPIIKLSVYIHSEELSNENLAFYTELIKADKVKYLNLAFRQLPNDISTQNKVLDLSSWSQNSSKWYSTLIDLLKIQLKVSELRIDYFFVESIGTASLSMIYQLILDMIERASFITEIYFSTGYLPTEDIIKFIKVVSK